MSASLVGSEMCIRDRPQRPDAPAGRGRAHISRPDGAPHSLETGAVVPVSYTHLTLPTICSV
eukprot:125780-Alexandrium_andersonii.AAC.1